MNYDTKEMIKLYSSCTGNTNKNDIINILSKSRIYAEVSKGDNEAFLYEGFISNLLDIVDDLKKQGDYPKEIESITPESIALVMRVRKEEASKRRSWWQKLFSKTKNVAAL